MEAGTSYELLSLKSSNTMMEIQRFFTGFLTRKTICHSWTNIYVKDSYDKGKGLFWNIDNVGCIDQILKKNDIVNLL